MIHTSKARVSFAATLLFLLTLFTSILSAQPPIDPPQPFPQDQGQGRGQLPELPMMQPTSDFNVLRTMAVQNGTVRVIVNLNANPALTAPSSNVPDFARTTAIRGAQGLALASIVGGNVSHVKQFNYVPLMALEVDAAGLEQLRNSPYVSDIQLDAISMPFMDTSTTQIGVKGAGGVWEKGITGKGTVVAVLDSGVDKAHPALSGQVISEACYSTATTFYDGAYYTTKSACPGSAWGATSTGSAGPCDLDYFGCDHGTHVAGTVASTDETYKGVAPDAKILAIQVFSEFPATYCGYKCALSFVSDQIAGLERVYALRHTYNIAAANMSLGGGQYTTCDSDARKPIIDLLRSVNIATVIASGNNGWINRVSTPGCVTTAITVGSVTGADVISSFSNNYSVVDMLAPGSAITSSVPGGGFDTWNGTSMATPHVAGTWALMRQAYPVMSVSEVENYLESTGLNVADTRSGGTYTKPRIRVNTAMNAAPPMEILSNGGIEIDVVKNNVPDAWTVLNRTKDRIKCNTETKDFAYTGDCAFMFRGSTGENAILRQGANLAAANLTNGDVLTLGAWVKGVGIESKVKLKVRVIYDDGSPMGKLNVIIGPTAGYEYFSDSVAVTSSSIRRVKVMAQHRSRSGKVFLDEVTLDKNVALQAAPADVLPLPEAPEGFRQ